MGASIPPNDKPIERFDDLLEVFRSAEKPRAEWRVGAEMEKFGVDERSGEAINYAGARGVGGILEELAKRYGWNREYEYDGAPLIALTRDGASITLEPGSQLELSGAPLVHAHQVCAEFSAHLRELRPISEPLGLVWLGLGFHPFARRSDFFFVPKQRYGIMREYLPTRGALALDMMLRTSTVQANFDYDGEADAMRKVRVATKLAPVVTAMFANSPFYEGKPFGGKSYRAKVWLDVDPDRSGLVPPMWKADAGYADYVEWALDAPMFMVKRGGEKVHNTGQTFRAFWKDGFGGHRALYSDWVTHLNTLFPEVRLKKTIEVRGADAQGAALACALPAVTTGMLYDDAALGELDELTRDWTLAEVTEARRHVWKDGLAVPLHGATLKDHAARVLSVASGALERRHHLSAAGKDERSHLAKLQELVAQGLTPADKLLEGLDKVADARAEIIARTNLGWG